VCAFYKKGKTKPNLHKVYLLMLVTFATDLKYTRRIASIGSPQISHGNISSSHICYGRRTAYFEFMETENLRLPHSRSQCPYGGRDACF